MIFFTANELVLQTSIYQCFSKISYFYSFSKRCSEILLEKHNISQIFSKVIKKFTAQVQTHVLQLF